METKDAQLLEAVYGDSDTMTDEEQKIVEMDNAEDLEAQKKILEEAISGEPEEDDKPPEEKEIEGETKPPEEDKKPTEEKETKEEKDSEPDKKETSDEKDEEKPPEKDGDGEVSDETPEFLKHEIDDDVLKLYPEDERRFLEKYKGKSLADGLKALAHSQRLVGKKNALEEPEEETALPNDEKTQQFIQETTLKQLRQKYADREMPEGDLNSDEVKEWIRDLMDDDPIAYHDFMDDKKATEETVKKDFKKAYHIAKNHTEINKKTLEGEIQAIKSQLQEWGINDPSEANIDLELKEQDGNYSNEMLNSLMLNGEQPDETVISFYGKYPLLVEGRLRQKFFSNYGKQIISAIVAKQKGDAIKEHERLKKEVPNTLAGGGRTGIKDGSFKETDIAKTNDIQAIEKARRALEAQFGL